MQNEDKTLNMGYASQPSTAGIPRDFINHDKVKIILCSILESFGYEEQMAICYFHLAGISIGEISQATELSESHVESALALYVERLEEKLNFLKKSIPFDEGDLLPISEMLVQEL